MMHKIQSYTWCAVLSAVVASGVMVNRARAAGDDPSVAAQKQRELIRVLESDAPAAEKAVTCKRLAVYGTKDAVPDLEALLSDPRLASWARIALEAIPDPAADDALREAMGKLQGKLLIGVINSIGYRRDAKAVGGLIEKLKDTDVDVAAAGAAALGCIGGGQAVEALTQSLSGTPEAVRAEAAEGCVRCARQYLKDGNYAKAVELYDTVRNADVPKHKVLEATRGAILARQSDGLPLLLEQLRSSDKGRFRIGLLTARELPGTDVTEALKAELERNGPDRATLILMALADRHDYEALPAVCETAKSGPKELRIAALGLLENLGNTTCMQLLLDAAAESDADVAQAAKTTLVRMTGDDVDADILTRLPDATGKTRQVLIDLAGQRLITAALPIILGYAEDTDAGTRLAAIETIGALGEAKQAGDLVRLLQRPNGQDEHAAIEKAILAITNRKGESCVSYLLPLASNNNSALRKIALHTLSSVGGPDALAAVKAAIDDSDEGVQDEAVRTLSTWANNWPEDEGVAEPLLALAKSGKKTAYRVLGLRGYLQYVQGDKKLKNEEKVAKLDELLPLLSRPEEKRLAVSVAGAIPTGGSLELLTTLAQDPAIAEEAYLAIVNLSARNDLGNASKELRQKSLQRVVEKSEIDGTKKKAEESLKNIQ